MQVGQRVLLRAPASRFAIARRGLRACAEHGADRGRQRPPADADVGRSRVRASRESPITVSVASSVADAALSSTVALRKSPNPQRSRARRSTRTPSGPSIMRVGLLLERRRRLVRAHADAQRIAQPAALLQLGQAAERVEVGDVVADVDRRGEVGVVQQADDPGALVDPHRRPDLEHLATPVGDEPGLLGRFGDVLDRGQRAVLVGHAAPVQGGDRLLVLQPHPQPPQLLAERARARRPARGASRPAARGPAPARSRPGISTSEPCEPR